MSENTSLRITIQPEPNQREKAAIAAVVVAMASKVQDDETNAPTNRWREAGKRETLRKDLWEIHP